MGANIGGLTEFIGGVLRAHEDDDDAKLLAKAKEAAHVNALLDSVCVWWNTRYVFWLNLASNSVILVARHC